MPVPFGKPVQERTLERDPRGRVDRVEAIHLVDRLSPHDGPPARALLEEIVEPSDARDVDEHAVDGRALIDRHPRLRDRSEEHTSELQSRFDLVCRLLLEKKKTNIALHPE